MTYHADVNVAIAVDTPRGLLTPVIHKAQDLGDERHGRVQQAQDDVEAERKRLEKDLAKANKELEQTGKKLANESFLTKAPDEVVEKIRTRQQVAQEEVDRITARLEALK